MSHNPSNVASVLVAHGFLSEVDPLWPCLQRLSPAVATNVFNVCMLILAPPPRLLAKVAGVQQAAKLDWSMVLFVGAAAKMPHQA